MRQGTDLESRQAASPPRRRDNPAKRLIESYGTEEGAELGQIPFEVWFGLGLAGCITSSRYWVASKESRRESIDRSTHLRLSNSYFLRCFISFLFRSCVHSQIDWSLLPV